jgi:hypothetical protein
MIASELQVQVAVVADHHEMVTAAAPAGGSTLTVTDGGTAAAADLYADGYAAITDGPGQGQTFKVKSHTASAGSAAFVLTFFDEIETAITAASTTSLIRNPYDSPQQSNTTVAEVPVGVPNVAIAGGEYGWLQTAGPCAVVFDESIATVGQALTVGTGAAGSVEEDDTISPASQEFIVGHNMMAGVLTESQIVNLCIRY